MNTFAVTPFDLMILCYTRRGDDILFTSGPYADSITNSDIVRARNSTTVSYDPSLIDVGVFKCDLPLEGSTRDVAIYEKAVGCSSPHDIMALVLLEDGARQSDGGRTNYFIRLVLGTVRLGLTLQAPVACGAAVHSMTERIVDIFDVHLRHRPEVDFWDSVGREYFSKQIHYHVERQARIEFILPAFPFKANNVDKVTGVNPDFGEEIAMRTLLRFIAEICAIYPPGAKFLIVSDGHVFSDSVGVDDAICYRYNAELRTLAAQLWRLKDHEGPTGEQASHPGSMADRCKGSGDMSIGFFGLEDLLRPSAVPMLDSEASSFYSIKLEHDVPTTLTQDAEQCRQVLMGICGGDGDRLRSKIKQDEAVLCLYQGFTRIVLEDVGRLDVMASLPSRNQKQKLAKAVAFQMLRRNEAYSRLVEALFPAHVRLSIHPHPNKGPKFGINLIHPTYLSASDTTSVKSDQRALHTPTPWHNAVVRKDEFYEMKRVRVIREESARGEKRYRWIERGPDGIGGGYYEALPSEGTEDSSKEIPVYNLLATKNPQLRILPPAEWKPSLRSF